MPNGQTYDGTGCISIQSAILQGIDSWFYTLSILLHVTDLYMLYSDLVYVVKMSANKDADFKFIN